MRISYFSLTNVIWALFVVVLALSPTLSPAQETSISANVVVEAPWARASIGLSRPGAAYMTIRNSGDTPITLTGIRAEVSGMASIHESRTDANGISSMTPAGDIEILPEEFIELKPGGYHAMLMRLQFPMVKGEIIKVVLLFADGAEQTVDVPVLGIGARGPEE